MDLHITDKVIPEALPIPGGVQVVNPRNQAQMDDILGSPLRLPYILPPGRGALFSTEEEVYLPPDTAGLIGVRGTWMRLGIITPLTIVDPGFKGTLTIRAFNSSFYGLLISPGDSIWSMTRVRLEPKSEPMYDGRYQDQKDIQPAKALED